MIVLERVFVSEQWRVSRQLLHRDNKLEKTLVSIQLMENWGLQGTFENKQNKRGNSGINTEETHNAQRQRHTDSQGCEHTCLLRRVQTSKNCPNFSPPKGFFWFQVSKTSDKRQQIIVLSFMSKTSQSFTIFFPFLKKNTLIKVIVFEAGKPLCHNPGLWFFS